jgi:hypothetical protein
MVDGLNTSWLVIMIDGLEIARKVACTIKDSQRPGWRLSLGSHGDEALCVHYQRRNGFMRYKETGKPAVRRCCTHVRDEMTPPAEETEIEKSLGDVTNGNSHYAKLNALEERNVTGG